MTDNRYDVYEQNVSKIAEIGNQLAKLYQQIDDLKGQRSLYGDNVLWFIGDAPFYQLVGSYRDCESWLNERGYTLVNKTQFIKSEFVNMSIEERIKARGYHETDGTIDCVYLVDDPIGFRKALEWRKANLSDD